MKCLPGRRSSDHSGGSGGQLVKGGGKSHHKQPAFYGWSSSQVAYALDDDRMEVVCYEANNEERRAQHQRDIRHAVPASLPRPQAPPQASRRTTRPQPQPEQQPKVPPKMHHEAQPELQAQNLHVDQVALDEQQPEEDIYDAEHCTYAELDTGELSKAMPPRAKKPSKALPAGSPGQPPPVPQRGGEANGEAQQEEENPYTQETVYADIVGVLKD